MMEQMTIRDNITAISIIVFLSIFIFIQYLKPNCFYNIDGSIRAFGIGYKNKTILPLWLFSIILGILSYIGVVYYLKFI